MWRGNWIKAIKWFVHFENVHARDPSSCNARNLIEFWLNWMNTRINIHIQLLWAVIFSNNRINAVTHRNQMFILAFSDLYPFIWSHFIWLSLTNVVCGWMIVFTTCFNVHVYIFYTGYNNNIIVNNRSSHNHNRNTKIWTTKLIELVLMLDFSKIALRQTSTVSFIVIFDIILLIQM